jgi:hypothetical protein
MTLDVLLGVPFNWMLNGGRAVVVGWEATLCQAAVPRREYRDDAPEGSRRTHPGG